MNRKYLFIPILGLLLFFVGINLSDAVKPNDHGLKEGDLISAMFSDDPDVYIINEYGYKRLFLNPEIFEFYGHLGGFFNVKVVTPEVRDAFETSVYFRNCENDDEKVYGVQVEGEDIGILRWLDIEASAALDEDPEFFKKVFCINNNEFNWYPKGNSFKSVKDVPKYSRGNGQEKTLICHYPPDNPENYHEIRVATPALKAHLAHGDVLGPCTGEIPSPTPTPTVTPSPTATPTPTITPTPTPTPDITPPVISDLTVSNITSNAASISWVTDEDSDSVVDYGVFSGSYSFSETGSTVASGSDIFEHAVGLTGLGASTSYYFMVSSTDLSNNTGTSSEQTFTTSILP